MSKTERVTSLRRRVPPAIRAVLGPVGLALISLLLAEVSAAQTAEASKERREPIPGKVIFGQVPVDAAQDEDTGELPVGSRIVTLDPARPDAGVTNLTAGFAAAGRPNVSFDGKRVLLVGKRQADEPLGVWEMGIDGADLRQVVTLETDCTRAVYLSTIFTIDHGDPAYQIAFVTRDDDGVPAIYTCHRDGTNIARITFSPFGAEDPHPLSDGRLLYSSGRPPKKGSVEAAGASLFTVNTDGTDVAAFAAAPESPVFPRMSCETPGGDVVFVELLTDEPLSGGSLVAVSRSNSLHSRRVIRSDTQGHFSSPAALPDGRLLVSFRSADAPSWGLAILNAEDADSVDSVFDAAAWHDVDAVVAVARPEPAGRSSVVDDRSGTGLLYCMDSYLTGLGRSDVAKGSIRQVQVYQAQPAAAGPLAERLLGAAKVEPDGSFFLEVPVRTPLRLQTIDADGDVVQAMRNWIWVMPREARGCVGCHEDRRLTPPNQHVLALQKRPKRVGVDATKRFVPADERPETPSEPE